MYKAFVESIKKSELTNKKEIILFFRSGNLIFQKMNLLTMLMPDKRLLPIMRKQKNTALIETKIKTT